MAGLLKDPETEYVLKKGANDIPVDACKGWFDPCEYCDKRFCEWIPADEEVYEKIPEKPGFFMISLKNKNNTEVVSILYDQTNIQKTAITNMDKIKEQISNKKTKATKSTMLIRWMVIKKTSDKENSILCAHWNNNGVLPRFVTAWPGQNLMEESEAIMFSNKIQKWCYPQKNPTWRKPKPPPSKTIEVVTKCNFQSCEICDSYFTPWKPLSEVIEKGLAPNHSDGLVMVSIVYGKSRDVLAINNHPKNIVVPIESTIKDLQRREKYYYKEYVNKNPQLEVRWMLMKDVDCDNSCFLYAHWFNADKWPPHNQTLPGENLLNKNKNFVFRNDGKKWFYETEALKPSKFSKAKNRRRLFDELEDELYNEEEFS